MKKANSILVVMVFATYFSSTITISAQQDEFNNRIIQDHIFAMHLYRDKLLNDKYRPVYHFVIPEGIAHPNDPNGAIYWKGRYHLFYIFQPVKPRKGHRGDAWAHISSHDLIHWRFHPTALKPGDDSPEVAIYSGNAFLNKKGNPTIIYHGLGAGNCIATSKDDMLTHWRKSEENPVIPYPEFEMLDERMVYRSIFEELPDYGISDVWDPHAWLEGDTYYSISGDNGTWPGKTALYKSEDMKEWELVGDFFHHDGVKDRMDCPDFFKLDNKYILVYLKRGVEYIIGDFKNEQFYPEKKGTMSWNCGVGYAPESLKDDKGRRIMWAALNDSRTPWGGLDKYISIYGWCGTLSLPRVLSLDENNDLLMEPVEELQVLRSGHIQKKDLAVNDVELIIEDIEGNSLELELTIYTGDAEEFGIKVCCSPDGVEQTAVIFNVNDNKVKVDLSKTSLDKSMMEALYEEHEYLQEAELDFNPDTPIDLQIFIDHSVLEVFVNNRLCLTNRIYPTREDSKGIVLFSKGGSIEVPVLNAWKMSPSNPY
jgi:sucrose-6-phosphate hydrolase SacC (GH32 family)